MSRYLSDSQSLLMVSRFFLESSSKQKPHRKYPGSLSSLHHIDLAARVICLRSAMVSGRAILNLKSVSLAIGSSQKRVMPSGFRLTIRPLI